MALVLGCVAIVCGLVLCLVLKRGRDRPDASNASSAVMVVPAARIVPVSSPADAGARTPEQRLAAEPVDPEWAPLARETVERSLTGIPFLTAAGPLSVRCRRTICQATGTLPPLMGAEARSQFLELLKGPMVGEPLARDGLRLRTDQPAAIEGSDSFILYVDRSGGAISR